MKSLLSYLKLPETEEIRIQTGLSKANAIARIDRLTGKTFVFSRFLWGESEAPRFTGKTLDDGFEVFLARDVAGYKMSPFFSPLIRAKILGLTNVQIHADLEYARAQKFFYSVWTKFTLLWLVLWLIGLPISNYSEIWGSSVSPDAVSFNSQEEILVVVLMFFALWLFSLAAVFTLFIVLPRWAIVQTMKRSKLLIRQIYDGDEVAPN